MSNIKKLLIIYILLIATSPTMAQQPILLSQKYKSDIWDYNDNNFLLTKKSILGPKNLDIRALMLSDFKFKKIFFNKDSTKQTFGMILENNKIQMVIENPYSLRSYEPFRSNSIFIKLHKNQIIGDKFSLEGKYGWIHADSNEVDLRFTRLKISSSLDLDYNLGSVESFSSKITGLTIFHQKSRTDSLHLYFTQDTLNRLRIIDTEVKKLNVHFTDCYFPSFISIECRNQAREISKEEIESFYAHSMLNIYFTNCKLTGMFASNGCNYPSKTIFDNVEFGRGARIEDLSYDTLIFKNCNQFNGRIPITLDKSDKLIYLSFVDTDVSKLDLFFSDRIRIFFDDSVLTDQITNTYENLLAKYKLEGKLESYKNVDIQYIHYKNSKFGFLGNFLSTVDRYWWYYGYKKELIFLWTTGFLLAFYILNRIYWKQMQLLYPIINYSRGNYSNKYYPIAIKINHWVSVFVYTAFIFFSLRIDFSKISYDRSRFIIFFFIQYIVGLMSMFFIANAIFKFSS